MPSTLRLTISVTAAAIAAGREVKVRNWSADVIRVRAGRPSTGPTT